MMKKERFSAEAEARIGAQAPTPHPPPLQPNQETLTSRAFGVANDVSNLSYWVKEEVASLRHHAEQQDDLVAAAKGIAQNLRARANMLEAQLTK